MANISRNELRSAVKELLKGADLDSLSTKKIRLALQGKFGTDFTERKKEVDEIVMSLLDESQDQDEEETNNKKTNGNADESYDDDSESELSEEDEPPKKKSKTNTQQAKKVKNKSAEIVPDDDEDLARQLQEDDGRRRSGRTPQKAPKEKKKAKKSEKSDGERKAKGYGKPCLLSPALAEVMGTDRLPRCDVVKKMYAIAKEKNLQDPKNRQFMICDDALFKIFGKKRVKMFGMMKHLSAHITDHHKIPDLS